MADDLHKTLSNALAGAKPGPYVTHNGKRVRLVVGHGLTPSSKPRPSKNHIGVVTGDGARWWVSQTEVWKPRASGPPKNYRT